MSSVSACLSTSLAGARVTCPSIEADHSRSSMPGVRAQKALTVGRYFQTLFFCGTGYTLCGLVTEEQGKSLRDVCSDWTRFPYMTSVYTHGNSGNSDTCVSIVVDMIYRTARIEQGGRELASWSNLPDRVFVAAAFKRNTERGAILMPAMHWKVVEVEQ